MLVDEVEPEEAVAVHASGVAQAGEDVPGGGDGEEEERAGEGFEAAPVAEFAGEGEVEDGGGKEEDDGDQALGEDGEGEGGPDERRGRDWWSCDKKRSLAHVASNAPLHDAVSTALRMSVWGDNRCGMGARDWRRQ